MSDEIAGCGHKKHRYDSMMCCLDCVLAQAERIKALDAELAVHNPFPNCQNCGKLAPNNTAGACSNCWHTRYKRIENAAESAEAKVKSLEAEKNIHEIGSIRNSERAELAESRLALAVEVVEAVQDYANCEPFTRVSAWKYVLKMLAAFEAKKENQP